MTTLVLGNNTGNTAGVSASGLDQSSAAANYSGNYIRASTAGGSGNWRTVMKFTGFPATAPTTVTSAVLTITVADADASARGVVLRQLLTAFTEAQVTWNERVTGTNWNVAGVLTGTDVNSTTIATGTIPSSGTFTISGAGFTALVQGWMDGSITNNGVILSLSDESTASYSFLLRQPAASDGDRPYLTVDYTAGSTPTLSVSDPTAVNAASGSSAVFTVTLSASSASVITCTSVLTNITAYQGTDYTGPITSAMCSNGVTVSGSTMSIPAGVTSFTVTVPVT